MSTKRKGLSQKLRFEVFKRDSFKCQYCGNEPPKVVLHVDHIKPVAKGGKNDLLNLITACVECNQGKTDIELSDSTAIEKQKRLLNELNERREQLEMLIKWRDGLADLNNSQVEVINNSFHSFTGYSLSESGVLTAKKLLKKHSLSEILSAIDEASLFLLVNSDGVVSKDSALSAWNKIGGILRVSKMPFYMKDLFYIRGICRRRFRYCDDVKAISLLKNAYLGSSDEYSHDALIDRLKEVVCSARNWSQFNNEMLRF